MKEPPARQIVDYMNRIYDGGMTTSSGGNLSVREPDGTVWITPSGIDKGTLTEADIVRLKADGTADGLHRPSIEHPFHRAIYAARPEAGAVLHAHPPALIAFSMARTFPDTRITPDIRRLCGQVALSPYAVQGSRRLGGQLAAACRAGADCVVMENHGVVTVGTDLFDAYRKLEALDFAARMIYHASLTGQVRPLRDEEISAVPVRSGLAGTAPVSGAWPEERRQLAAFAARCCRRQLFAAALGTAALRTPDGFLVTPAGGDRLRLKSEEIVHCRDGRGETGKELHRDAELAQAILTARPEVNAVCCAAPPQAMGFAVGTAVFDSRSIPESYAVLRETPVFDFGDRSAAAARLSPRYPAAIIRNDCVVVIGKSLPEAFDRLEVLEYSSRAAISAARLGGVRPMSDAQVAELIEAMKLLP